MPSPVANTGGSTHLRSNDEWGEGVRPSKRLRVAEVVGELGVGVREMVRESIRIGRKEWRYGVVAMGTPFWEWVVPTGGGVVLDLESGRGSG